MSLLVRARVTQLLGVFVLKYLIIESAHPSPFSAYNGFFGSKPFSRTNEFLKKNNMEEIKW